MFKSDNATLEVTRDMSSPDRPMSITPLDMRQARFAKTMRGFDTTAVTSFLQDASDGFEQALRENERLRQEIARLDATLTQFRDLETGLKNTLVTAQKVADDMRENATQEAARIISDAEGRADLLMQRTQARAEHVEHEIDALRIKRREAESSIESTIAALHNTLDFIRGQDHREERLTPHRAMAGAA